MQQKYIPNLFMVDSCPCNIFVQLLVGQYESLYFALFINYLSFYEKRSQKEKIYR